MALGAEIQSSIVWGECSPFGVGVKPGELIVLRGLDVHADGRKKADVQGTRVVRADVGYGSPSVSRTNQGRGKVLPYSDEVVGIPIEEGRYTQA